MSVHMTRHKLGDLFRLQCDWCGTRSGIYLAGRSGKTLSLCLLVIRNELRSYSPVEGWGLLPGHDGPEARDLCRDCCKKVEGVLLNPKGNDHGQAQSGAVDGERRSDADAG